MLLRLSNYLLMELADLFIISLPKEGTQGDGWCLVAVIDQGKTNQYGRLEYGAALRYRDYRSCLVGALAYISSGAGTCLGSRFLLSGPARTGTVLSY
jgi:hypothetical protein